MQLRVSKRKGVVVATKDDQIHVLFGRIVEENVRYDQEISFAIWTGPFTEDRTYEGKVVGMVLDVQEEENETGDDWTDPQGSGWRSD